MQREDARTREFMSSGQILSGFGGKRWTPTLTINHHCSRHHLSVSLRN